MRRIPDIYAAKRATGRPVVSVEFFPPKTPAGEDRLFDEVLPALGEAPPDYCSVTYGAGGGTRGRTLQIVDRMQREHGLTAMAHVTCVSFTRGGMQTFLDEAATLGIENILALRGDPPADQPNFRRPEGGFDYASDLIGVIRRTRSDEFAVGCAGFPEGHPDCAEGKHADWGHLKTKVDAGAEFVLTQLFFDNAYYFEMVDYVTGALGVTVPITPGILPILNTKQIKRFTALCGATLPPPLLAELDRLGDDDASVTAFGIDYATRQCEALLAAGAPGLHLYGLNRAHSPLAILRNLGLAQQPASA
ncbi:MAG: methylenetetrahydrofolate reductase [NAD(P)H] [Acidobacteria bacterium]|nr:methylenetetrahydrofolate reductase [NAD(P)H] [Acidobacteriota bacterium]MYJ03236.1 methylenetetrahydrofolate reductase [NAD(P)H] [Acidobacteriota bacterium]